MALLNSMLGRVARRRTAVCTLVAAWSLLCTLGGFQAALADTGEAADTLERQVKAAYLYKFAGYVEWPEASFSRPEAPITIGVLGAEALAGDLAQLVAGRTANSRTITAKRLKPGDALSGVNILFVGKEETGRLTQLVALARPHAVLIVTESEGALTQGSVINFTLVDRRVRFEISLGSAEKSSLKLSSRLLAVAQQVYPGAQ
jgi:hypothetical protein